MRAAVVAAVVLTVLCGQAAAFVREVRAGAKVFWKEPCVPVTIYFNGFEHSPNQRGMTVDATVKSIVAAAHAWSTDVVQCADGTSPYLEIVPTTAPLDAKPPAPASDTRNTIIFRTTDHWGNSKIDYDPDALAYTNVIAGPDGHITDVDIEINATNAKHVWMNLDPGVTVPSSSGHVDDEGTYYYDLQTALTHELGHFIGLGHTCFRPRLGEPEVTDESGAAVPDCDEPTPEADSAVMFATTEAGQTAKRRLSTDDVAGVCAIYAPSLAHDACKLDDPPSGCAVAAAPRSASARKCSGVALAVGLGAVVAARVRRRRVSGRDRARS